MEQRLTGLQEGGTAAAAWRGDAESLRSSIASFAAANPGMKIHTPDALPDAATRQAMTQQLSQLNDAVSQVIRQTPGTPFNLGQVEVTVSADLAEASPVTVGTGPDPNRQPGSCKRRQSAGLSARSLHPASGQ